MRRRPIRILDGYFDVFALESVRLGFPPRWNVDPKTGIEAPLEFGFGLDYRDAARVGDIKYLWEINRHLELVTLAQAWHLTASCATPRARGRLIDSWLTDCPVPARRQLVRQPRACHPARQLGLRLAAAGCRGARSLFQGEQGSAFRRRWLESIYRHCHFIARHFSRHSSANNHLIGEATGLFIVRAHLAALAREPALAGARPARTSRARRCCRPSMTAPTGSRRSGITIPWPTCCSSAGFLPGPTAATSTLSTGECWQSMLDFLASIMDVKGGVPAIGDADQGVLVRLVPNDASTQAANPSPAAGSSPMSIARCSPPARCCSTARTFA